MRGFAAAQSVGPSSQALRAALKGRKEYP